MNSEQLMQFKVIAECGSVTKASEIFFITQPSLSHTIKKLEEELDCNLFDRVGNKIELNANGKKLLSYCNRCNALFKELYKDFAQQESDGTIRVKTYSSIQAMFLEYAKLNHETGLKISNIHDYDDMRDLLNKNDVVIYDESFAQYVSPEGLKSQFFFEDELLLSVTPEDEFASRKFVTLEEIAKRGLSCVRSVRGGSLDRWIGDIARKSELEFKFVNEVTQSYWKTLHNSPYPFFSRSMVCLYEDTVLNARRYIPIDSPLVKKKIYIWYRKKNEKKLEEFLSYMETVSENFAEQRKQLP